ncbi:MAG: hypothetical protein QUS33_07415 [Dehalococcoidia bacterium]|nr:hypothetical protein [Dehalococcoidia bacterium]
MIRLKVVWSGARLVRGAAVDVDVSRGDGTVLSLSMADIDGILPVTDVRIKEGLIMTGTIPARGRRIDSCL